MAIFLPFSALVIAWITAKDTIYRWIGEEMVQRGAITQLVFLAAVAVFVVWRVWFSRASKAYRRGVKVFLTVLLGVCCWLYVMMLWG